MIDYYETTAHPITKKMVLEAYKEIKLNGNAAGVDGISLEGYAKNLSQKPIQTVEPPHIRLVFSLTREGETDTERRR